MPEQHFILIYEPNSRDALLLEDSFKKQSIANPARVLRQFSELQSYLTGAGLYANRELFPVPSLLLINFSEAVTTVNLMEWLRQGKFINRFPVIGVGTSLPSKILQLAFDLGMSGYYEKPSELQTMAQMIARLQWVDGWKLSDSTESHVVTREQFYRIGSV